MLPAFNKKVYRGPYEGRNMRCVPGYKMLIDTSKNFIFRTFVDAYYLICIWILNISCLISYIAYLRAWWKEKMMRLQV